MTTFAAEEVVAHLGPFIEAERLGERPETEDFDDVDLAGDGRWRDLHQVALEKLGSG